VNTYGRDQILAFLAEVDELLAEPVSMEIIGGAAALLAYGARSATKDIDSFAPIDERIRQAARLTFHKIPLDQRAVGVADPPYNYEDRHQRLDLPFHNLTVFVPERHDLLLMKALRAARHDEEVIEEMHQVEPFDLETIIERYNSEMSHAVGNHDIFDQRIQLIVEKLFNSKSARRLGKAAKRLK
jgi:hypothetical protein